MIAMASILWFALLLLLAGDVDASRLGLTCVERPRHACFERMYSSSQRERTNHHFASMTPSPFYSLRWKDQRFAAHAPRGVHEMAPLSATGPSIETPRPAAFPAPGPSPLKSGSRYHNGQQEESGVPSAFVAAAASPPTHRHPVDVISPTPDCSAVFCPAPLTRAPFLAGCGCVQPIEVELELSVPLYALFPIISVLAGELAEGALLTLSQVEIVGANASGQNQEVSFVDANFLPLQEEFDIMTATIIARKFWEHKVELNRTLFGNYTVAYIKYPGLPPLFTPHGSGTDTSGIQKPTGVDVSTPRKEKLGIHTTAAIVSSTVIVVAVCSTAVWLVLSKCKGGAMIHSSMSRLAVKNKKLGGGCSLLSTNDRANFNSNYFASSAITHGSMARLFTIVELDRATDSFAPENIVGEGGFGRVFRGVLDDGSDVAVKVLTRENLQGGKEFVAEVEMLSRLHHRNLVKLIGICTEGQSRCLVYELIPNGSVEFHLHGVKGPCSLDWETRLKIALGAARGLAYLHEDSNPRVIHRDFKAANILLDNDFNPKVSDFGLAKVAPDGAKEHLSTRVMGTFGYVAPEYAMTGHLLVKSDVYSYGVVLLELLSGRKPVDMSQPLGQENLVTWARPLLITMEGLQLLLDPTLKDSVSYNSLAKVAAIASMCVHPEVSDRPFMGEVVQALKLVCKDLDVNSKMNFTKHCQIDELPIDSLQTEQHYRGKSDSMDDESSVSIVYDSGSSQELQNPYAPAAPFFNDSRFIHGSGSSFGRHSLSVPWRQSHDNELGCSGIGIRGSVSEPAFL